MMYLGSVYCRCRLNKNRGKLAGMVLCFQGSGSVAKLQGSVFLRSFLTGAMCPHTRQETAKGLFGKCHEKLKRTAKGRRASRTDTKMVADAGKQQRKTLIRGVAYAILASTLAFAVVQVPVWQGIVTTELRKAAAAKLMAANPAVQEEALSVISENFARPLSPSFSLSRPAVDSVVNKYEAFDNALKSLEDKYTRVVGSAEMQELGAAFDTVPFVLRQNTDTGELMIARAITNSLQVGDRLDAINGVSTEVMRQYLYVCTTKASNLSTCPSRPSSHH